MCMCCVTKPGGEQSCIYVLGVSLPSQESEQSCVCVRGIVTKPGE